MRRHKSCSNHSLPNFDFQRKETLKCQRTEASTKGSAARETLVAQPERPAQLVRQDRVEPADPRALVEAPARAPAPAWARAEAPAPAAALVETPARAQARPLLLRKQLSSMDRKLPKSLRRRKTT